ncbi:hypothetical protein KUCAC02_007103 [Chaenocephalus aceratus]|nr:hypothetical protein KUCAC02_007103 [Chaenocephalus aceratus]
MDEHSVTTKMLKSEFILYKSYAAARTLRMPQIFSGILCDTERCKQYKGLSILFEIYLVLAVNTAVCERGFSCMKRVKNDWRSCLGAEQLSRLMFSSIEGPPWQKEQEIRDDLYEDLVLMDQEAEQEENVRQEAISDELGLEAENVAAGEKRLAEALDDSDVDTFLKDY